MARAKGTPYSPGLGIYPLLIRKKKGVAPEERLRELKEHFLLQKIEKEIPGQLTKVLIVQGDSQEIGVKLHNSQVLSSLFIMKIQD